MKTKGNGMQAVIASLWAALSAFLLSCSNDLTIAGGSDLPNGVVSVMVYDGSDTSNPRVNQAVLLKRVVISSRGDSSIVVKSAVSDYSGKCVFTQVPLDRYIISGTDTSSGNAALVSKVAVTGPDTVADTLHLLPCKTIEGRLLTTPTVPYDSLVVYIPGIDRSSRVDGNGLYIIGSVPLGQFDLAIRGDSTVNFLPIAILPGPDDTIFIKDVRFMTDSSASAYPYSFFESHASRAFAVHPVEYKIGSEPVWYRDKQFSKVLYFEGMVDMLRPYIPTIRQVLFVAGTLPLNEDEMATKHRLENMGITVFASDDDTVGILDTMNMDLVYFSYTVKPPIDSAFIIANVPIMVTNSPLSEFLRLADSGATGASYGIGSLEMSGQAGPLNQGLTGSLRVLDDSLQAVIAWATVKQATSVVAQMPGPKMSPLRGAVFSFAPGSSMAGIAAPAERIGFFAAENTAVHLTEAGWKLFEMVVMGGVKIKPGPPMGPSPTQLSPGYR